MPFSEGLKPGQPFVASWSEAERCEVVSREQADKFFGREIKKGKENSKETSPDRAREIMGTDYFGQEAAEQTFGLKIEAKDIPAIPFTEAELERAKELGQFLILRVDQGPDGQPLTMLEMNRLLEPDFTKNNNGKALYSVTDEWKLKSDFFTTETPTLGWALSSLSVIPETKNKDYLEQMRILAEKYLPEVIFKDQPLPPDYQAAILEFQAYYDQNFEGKTPEEINNLLGGDKWEKYAKELAALSINQLARAKEVEELFDTVIVFKNIAKRRLEKELAWTKSLSSSGGLVNFGYFVAGGASVLNWKPAYSYDILGVSFSRSH